MVKIDKKTNIELYRQMLNIRYFEEEVGKAYMEGKIHGTGHLYNSMVGDTTGIWKILM